MYSLISVIWTFIIVGLIIFFHELGHFLSAKKLGIKVERFSIGFGPKMVGFTKGETEYRISWLPFFGGYVKMLGENPNERPDGEEVEKEPEKGRFDLAPVPHRIIVAIAGPAMNIVLAIFMFAGAYMVGIQADPDTVISYVDPDSPALNAGMMSGDKILSVDGYKVKTWGDIQENVMTRPGEELDIVLQRGGNEKKTVQATPENMEIQVISIELDIINKLDNGFISDDLRQEFGIGKIPLTINANIQVDELGAKWTITDSDKIYQIRRENDVLEILQKTETEEMALVFGINLAFRTELALQNEMDNGIIPESLQRKFAGIDAMLSEDASIIAEKPGNEWLITDKNYSRGVFKWVVPSKEKQYSVKVEDDKINAYLKTGFGMLGLKHSSRTIVKKLDEDSTVAKAGLHLGDVIETVNGKEIVYDLDFVQELQATSGESVALTVKRGTKKVDLAIPLEYDENNRLTSFEGMSFTAIVRRNPITAFRMAVPETIRMGGKIFQFLKRMIVGDVSVKYIAGPVGIVQIALAVVKTGFAEALQFAGFLSVNLGIVNLLPLFITDGAMIIFLIIEALRRKPLEQKRQILIQQIGLGFIVLFFFLVTYNDIIRIVTGGI